MGKGSFKLTWRGPEIEQSVIENQAYALAEFGAVVVEEAQRELYPGHGYLTGALHDSLFWSLAQTALSINVQVGSPLPYAIFVHQGHRGFAGYHFLTIGLQRARGRLPEILRKYGVK